jgi:hypothetical protein
MHKVEDRKDLLCFDGRYIFYYRDGTKEEIYVDIDDNNDYNFSVNDVLKDLVGWELI